MDFDLTEEQLLIKKAARDFAEKELAPYARDWEEKKTFSRRVFDLMGELDFTGLYCPEEYGGTGIGRLSAALIFEELAKGCFATTVYLTVHNMVAHLIYQYGNEEQRQKWVVSLCNGKSLGAYALTEAGAGSDASAIITSAKRHGDGYLLNGSKLFVTSGGVADLYAVMVRTDETQKQKGISAVIVEKGMPGFSFGEHEDKMGLNAIPTTELILDDCNIPRSNFLGEEGQGFKIAMTALNGGRISIGASAIGLAQIAFDYGLAHTKERIQFGRPISTFQGIQFMLADMATEIESARLMIYKAAYLMDRGFPAIKEAAMAKRLATDVAMRVTTDVVQILGGYGYMKAYPVEMYMRFAKVAQIFEGTNQIQRVVIAREMLKQKAYKDF